MIMIITYGDDRWKNMRELNVKMAKKYGGADCVKAYTWEDIDENFRKRNMHILKHARGGGYWCWKPYVINDALSGLHDGDYLLWVDAGCPVINNVKHLILAMEQSGQSIMTFTGRTLCMEKDWAKRDALILLGCDEEKYLYTRQCGSGVLLLRKTEQSTRLISHWLEYAQDERIITDSDNILGLSNYDGFQENRHDQVILSLLSKKEGIEPFLMPFESELQSVNNKEKGEEYTDEELRRLIERSKYPPIMLYVHNRNTKYEWQARSKMYFKIQNQMQEIKYRIRKNMEQSRFTERIKEAYLAKRASRKYKNR